MRWKKYKPGDRVFYKCCDGTISTDIVLCVEERVYKDEKGYDVHYQWLDTDEYSGIENYNCLPDNSLEVKELKKLYAAFDRDKPEMVKQILDILSPYNSEMKKLLLKEIETKL